jgi:hypothetical protein
MPDQKSFGARIFMRTFFSLSPEGTVAKYWEAGLLRGGT